MDEMYFSNAIGYENKFKEDYDYLTKNTGDGFFVNKKDILVIAALIGFNNYSFDKIEKYKLEKKDFKNLNVKFDEYHSIIFSIAICHKKSSEVVVNKNEVSDIFNKCAGIGMEKFKEIILNDDGSIMMNFEDFIGNPEEYINLFDDEKEKNVVLNIIT